MTDRKPLVFDEATTAEIAAADALATPALAVTNGELAVSYINVTSTSSQHDYDRPETYVGFGRSSGFPARSITGMLYTHAGAVKIIGPHSTVPGVVAHDSASSSVGNRFFMRDSVDYALSNGPIMFIHDGATGWREVLRWNVTYGYDVVNDGYTQFYGDGTAAGVYWNSAANAANAGIEFTDEGAEVVSLITAGATALKVSSDGSVTIDTNQVWHAGNDGTGSGLDADLLDGQHASAFQPADAQLTSLAALSYAGNAGKVVAVNAGATDFELITAAGTGTVTSVNITAPAAGITASGGPITTTGAITLALADDLAAVEGLATTGIVRRTAANTWTAGTLTSVIGATFDGGGAAITAGSKVYVSVPFDCTLVEATALADVSGSAVVDVWKDTYANYPPTDADSITASAPVTISSATKSTDATLTGWTTTVTAGDVVAFNVDSCSTITKLNVQLVVERT